MKSWITKIEPQQIQNTPVVLKFDTTTNIVDVKTVYGITDPNPAYFDISAGTGSLILTFSTSSIMTSFFRIGPVASDITDHIYKVVKVSDESIEIQGYRSGAVYKPEGGVIYKLFKRPADWEWANNTINFDFTNPIWRTGIINRDGTFEIEYVDGTTPKITLNTKFGAWTDAQINTLRGRDPFVGNISAKGFLPMYNMIFDQSLPPSIVYAAADRTAPMVGHNAIAFYPFASTGTTSAATNANILSFASKIKTHYLVLTQITRSDATATAAIDMNFVSYDKTGKVYLTAKYTIR